MPNLNELVGTVIRTSEQVLHEDFSKRFAKATLQNDHSSLSYSALASLGDFEGVFKALKIHPKQALHTRESVTVFKEPIFEKAISIETQIKDLYEQQAGDKPMAFVVVQVTGNQSGIKAFVCERIWSISGGFPRA